MTIAISFKINDGLVLAADSATTILAQDPSGRHLFAVNIYNNANKVFNLKKGLPIGALTWGVGSIGNASISTLIKDLRRRFAGKAGDKWKDWKINDDDYNVKDVASRLKEFIYDELYVPAFKEVQKKPALGFIVAGYSSSSAMANEYKMDIVEGNCIGPVLLRQENESGMTWAGEPEALNRLVLGFSPQIAQVLVNDLKIPPDKVPAMLSLLQQRLSAPLITPAMPLQDALDLAEFMVDLTIKFSRFIPGAPTVGGPIELAAISKHEGFRWVKRKYYFTETLNPKTEEE